MVEPPAAPARLGWLAALAAVGLATAASSTWVHAQLVRDPAYAGFCDISATFNCAQAYTSRYGTLVGVPVALIGALFFALVLALAAAGWRSPAVRTRVPSYVFVLSTAGLAVVLYLAHASFVVLQTVCVLCVATYAAVIGLFIASGRAARLPVRALPRAVAADLAVLVRTPRALAGALAFAAAAAGLVVWFPAAGAPAAAAAAPEGGARSLTPAQRVELERFLASQPRVPVERPGVQASVVILKFNDYQCPACAQTYWEHRPVFERYAREHPGLVALVTLDFPLEPECNPLAPGGGHQAACEAAVAVRLARERGRGEAMEAWLYGNQASLTPESVRQAAREVGQVDDFEARYEAELARVREDVALGGRLDVRGTPTFFMNGLRLPGLRAEFLDAAIQWELARVRGGGS